MSGRNWETERDQAVTLLSNAATLIEALGSRATQGRWESGGIGDFGWTVHSVEGRFGVETEDSEQGRADAAWIALASPAIAPFLAGWLRKTAQIAASCSLRQSFEVYVDRKALGLAQHVMGLLSEGSGS